MQITNITISNFRNLDPQKIVFSSEQNTTIIVGNNGQGKTSLLEAIYVLGHGKSFRSAKTSELIQWSDQGEKTPEGITASVQAVVIAHGVQKEIHLDLKDGQRRIFVNGHKVTAATDFFGQLAVLEFTPDDLQLLKGSPSDRRKFVDKILAMLDPVYVFNLVQYQRALKSRNKLLSNRGERSSGKYSAEKYSKREDLKVWETVLIEHGTIVTEKRVEFIKRLRPKFQFYYEKFSRSRENISKSAQFESFEKNKLDYEGDFAEDEKILSSQQIAELFETGLPKDRRLGATSIGPHRDDFLVFFDTGKGFHSARGVASQGQTRSLVLAWKLAALDFATEILGETPVLLLDDVESELDLGRRTALLELLQELKCQVILTTTDLSNGVLQGLFEPQILWVENGQFHKQKIS